MKLHTESKIADKFKIAAIVDQNHETKHIKIMMYFNCCVRMHVFSTEGFLSLLTGLFLLLNITLNVQIYIISSFSKKIKFICMEFWITQLLT